MIPSTISTPKTNQNTTFLLLNNEYRNFACLKGFQLYAAQDGTITLQVKC
jgi:hypothetical protein